MAYTRGLGEMRLNRIQVMGASLRELRVPWAPAQARNQQLSAHATCPGRSCTWTPMVG